MRLADEVRIRFTPFCHSGTDRSERTNATYVQKDTVDRIAKFLEQKEGTAYAEGVLEGSKYERKRLLDLVDKKTGHYAQTHSAGRECLTCHILLIMEGE